MKIIIHEKAKLLLKVLSFPEEEVVLISTELIPAIWELSERFPNHLIGWCEKELVEDLNLEHWNEVFHHDHIMASYAVRTKFLPDSIGYIDQLPFVNVNQKVFYGTWQMSGDVGGIKGETLIQLKPFLRGIKSFEFFLNSAAKLGQQNGLFCYSVPHLVKSIPENVFSTASTKELFKFVYRHYKTIWTSILFWCYLKYEKKIPLLPYSQAYWGRKCFQEKIDLQKNKTSFSLGKLVTSIDVIIPTIGRPEHLANVLMDLSQQTYLPQQVIIVEQNSDRNSTTEIQEILNKSWPFILVHHFTHRVGACNARNIALGQVNAEWTFFADDDIRLEKDILKNAFTEIFKYGMTAINMNCMQKGEKTIFHKVKQWGGFGSGTSIVKSSFAQRCRFSLIYEHGYGEDNDYGMQLRNLGCDIIYHPGLEILHLKAPIGGFRNKRTPEWEMQKPDPKPSPTVMAFAKRFYSHEQILGYKTSLFLKYYFNQKIKNPFVYIRQMNIRWKISENWANELIRQSSDYPKMPNVTN